jgi:N-acetylneuraminic acid mutarotase
MARPRGAGGVATHGGKIYYAGGLQAGEAVAWFDEYDPKANSWRRLPDMPRVRDHFHAAVVAGRFHAIGGRDKDLGATTTANDAYDFASGTWKSGLAPLPTPRGGFGAAVVGDEILLIGGERPDGALGSVESYDTRTDSWRALEPMPTARHGIQGAVLGGAVYVAGGGVAPGAAPSEVTEAFVLAEGTTARPRGPLRSSFRGAACWRARAPRIRPRASSAPTGDSTSRSRTD